MAIKFNVIERGEPGVTGGGTKKYYASTKSSGEMTLNKLTNSIEKVSTVSGADIRAVLYAMVDVMKSLAGRRPDCAPWRTGQPADYHCEQWRSYCRKGIGQVD